MKAIYLALILSITGIIRAQDIGKIVIRNANINNPKLSRITQRHQANNLTCGDRQFRTAITTAFVSCKWV